MARLTPLLVRTLLACWLRTKVAELGAASTAGSSQGKWVRAAVGDAVWMEGGHGAATRTFLLVAQVLGIHQQRGLLGQLRAPVGLVEAQKVGEEAMDACTCRVVAIPAPCCKR